MRLTRSEWDDDDAYAAWLDEEYAKILDEAVAERRQQEALAGEPIPEPVGDEIPF